MEDILKVFSDALLSKEWDRNQFVSSFAHLALDDAVLNQAIDNIREYYQVNSKAVDGLSRIAYLLWGEGMCAKSRKLWLEDIESRHISWWQYLKYADTFAQEQDIDTAVDIVKNVYKNFSDAAGGYAGIGWRIRNYDKKRAVELFEIDIKENRMTEEFREKYALFLARNEFFDKALEQLNELPSSYLGLKAAYVKVSELLFSAQQWDKGLDILKNAPFDNWFKNIPQIPCTSFDCRDDNTLYAFYDFVGGAATFDIPVFLSHAEHRRKMLKLEHIKLVIVPATPNYYPMWYPASPERQAWRMHNILYPCAEMLPSCSGIIKCADRTEALKIDKLFAKHRFPEDYSVSRPTLDFYFKCRTMAHLPGQDFEPSETAIRNINRFCQTRAPGKRVITITLRETDVINKDRNSNISAWAEFLSGLDKDAYYPIVLRDQDKAMGLASDALSEYCVLPEAVWNLHLRAALYKMSYLNLGTGCGPMMFCAFIPDTRLCVFALDKVFHKR